jgi:hypothetical protein
MNNLEALREKIARDIAFICGDNYDAYNDEDKESCLWWADKILTYSKEAVMVSPEEIEAIRAEERREIFNLLEGYRTGANEKGMLYTIPFHVWKEFREASGYHLTFSFMSSKRPGRSASAKQGRR